MSWCICHCLSQTDYSPCLMVCKEVWMHFKGCTDLQRHQRTKPRPQYGSRQMATSLDGYNSHCSFTDRQKAPTALWDIWTVENKERDATTRTETNKEQDGGLDSHYTGYSRCISWLTFSQLTKKNTFSFVRFVKCMNVSYCSSTLEQTCTSGEKLGTVSDVYYM